MEKKSFFFCWQQTNKYCQLSWAKHKVKQNNNRVCFSRSKHLNFVRNFFFSLLFFFSSFQFACLVLCFFLASCYFCFFFCIALSFVFLTKLVKHDTGWTKGSAQQSLCFPFVVVVQHLKLLFCLWYLWERRKTVQKPFDTSFVVVDTLKQKKFCYDSKEVLLIRIARNLIPWYKKSVCLDSKKVLLIPTPWNLIPVDTSFVSVSVSQTKRNW